MNMQEWLQIKEEFGDEAFKRFIVKKDSDWLVFYSNKHVEQCLLTWARDFIELKPLPELFEMDSQVYGFENAIKMWQFKNLRKGEWEDLKATKIEHVIESFGFEREFRRKTSAALPFDLERAKAGDVVEIENEMDKWTSCNFEFITEDEYDVKVYDKGIFMWVAKERLRMKYPPRIKP